MNSKFVLLILFLAVVLTTTASAIENKETDLETMIAAIEAHPQTGPLWKCFQDGFKLSVGEVANKAKNEHQYYGYTLALGGFSDIGDRVRLACDKVVIGDLKGQPMPRILQQVNDVFIGTLLVLDQQFFDQCRAKTGVEWDGVKALCSRQEEIFKAQFRSQ